MTRRPRRPQDRARGGEAPAEHARRLAEMRALAHPLRLRLAELFAEKPRTTKQAAAVLGEPPTRLYHHVHALESVGLLRLRETRRKRGTHEKYYEVPPSLTQPGAGARRARFAGPASRRQRAALAATVLDVTRAELASAVAESARPRRGVQPFVARVLIRSPAVARRLRAELMALLRRHAKAARSSARAKAAPTKSPRTKAGATWSLTMLLLPSGAAAGTRPEESRAIPSGGKPT